MSRIITQVKTQWHDKDNYIYLIGKEKEVGCIEMAIYKEGEHEGEAYIWNLFVDENHRKNGFGKDLIVTAIIDARSCGCSRVALEWDIKDSPQWVYDWYTRLGFEEKLFNNGYAIMEKKL